METRIRKERGRAARSEVDGRVWTLLSKPVRFLFSVSSVECERSSRSVFGFYHSGALNNHLFTTSSRHAPSTPRLLTLHVTLPPSVTLADLAHLHAPWQSLQLRLRPLLLPGPPAGAARDCGSYAAASAPDEEGNQSRHQRSSEVIRGHQRIVRCSQRTANLRACCSACCARIERPAMRACNLLRVSCRVSSCCRRRAAASAASLAAASATACCSLRRLAAASLAAVAAAARCDGVSTCLTAVIATFVAKTVGSSVTTAVATSIAPSVGSSAAHCSGTSLCTSATAATCFAPESSTESSTESNPGQCSPSLFHRSRSTPQAGCFAFGSRSLPGRSRGCLRRACPWPAPAAPRTRRRFGPGPVSELRRRRPGTGG